MEPSTPTEEFDRPRRSTPPEDATVVLPGHGAEPLRTAASASGQHCASCGAVLTPDQRYCVECGQRRGPTRPPFAEAPSQQQASASAPPPKRGPRISPNTALIAGIGTLMLALATGVLIGRTSSPSSKNAPVQYVTAPTSGTPSTGTGTTGVPTTTESSSTTNTAGAGGSKGSSAKTAGGAAASKVLGGKAPSKPVVSVGSPGKGAGYQKGKFTGKFFGGGESKKKEEEEELGEEESSGSEKGKK